MDLGVVVNAITSTLDPQLSNEKRAKYFAIIEAYKVKSFQLGDLLLLCSPNQHSPVILFGLQCLDYMIKHSWTNLGVEQKGVLKDSLFQLGSSFESFNLSDSEKRAFCLRLSQMFVHLIKCEWPQQWPGMIDEFLVLGKTGHAQAKVVLMTFLRLFEDVIQLQSVPASRRRDIVGGINDNLSLLLGFALDVVQEEVDILQKVPNSIEHADVCREAVRMLSGYFETCRLDIVRSWTPRSTAALPFQVGSCPYFFTLVANLLNFESIRTEALCMIQILLSRKSLSGSDADSHNINIAHCLLRESSTFCNCLIQLLCLSLSEEPVFSDQRYNFLLLISDVIVRIGCQLVSHWSEYVSNNPPCTCPLSGKYQCDNVPSHILQAIVCLTSYQIRAISASSNTFWSQALRSSESPLREYARCFSHNLFSSWRRNLIKDGDLTGSSLQSIWNRAIFEADDYGCFAARYRSEILKCMSLGASVWPDEIFGCLKSWIEDLLGETVRCKEKDQFKADSSPVQQNWEALEVCLESILPVIKQKWDSPDKMNVFNQVLTSIVRHILQLDQTSNPNLQSRYVSCISLMLRQIDLRQHEDILFAYLNQVFLCFRYNPIEGSTLNSTESSLLSKIVRAMHMNTATSFFRFTRTQHKLLVPHFNLILTEVVKLWPEKTCGVMAKCILLEALITLCLRLTQPIEMQFDFLKQLLVGALEPWSPNELEARLPDSFAKLLLACNSGGLGLAFLLGFNHPLETISNQESEYLSCRMSLIHNILFLLAICRRLSEPPKVEQLEQISRPLLEPVFLSVVRVLRAFNELWLPDVLASIHPSILPAFDQSEQVRTAILNPQNKPLESKDGDPLYRIRTFLTESHDNLMMIMGSMFVSLGPHLYALPTDQLTSMIHQSCCAGFEHLPDLKFNNLLRTIILPFIRRCPKENLATAVAPVIPPIVEAVAQRTDCRWDELRSVIEQNGRNTKEVTQEIILDRLARLLGRSCMDLLRILFTFNGYEPSDQSKQPEDVDIEDEDDVDMGDGGTSSGNGTASSHGDSNSIGILARLLLSNSLAHAKQSQTPCTNPLFLQILVAALAWPDSLTCLKASQWILTLIDVIARPLAEFESELATLNSDPSLAELLMFSILRGLHVNGKNAENTIHGLLTAGLKVYTVFSANQVQERLDALVLKVLLAQEQQQDQPNNQGNEAEHAKISKQIQIFKSKILTTKGKPCSEKVKRDAFKKLIDPIIGVPLSQRFRDVVKIASLAPVIRPKWRSNRNNTEAVETDFGLTSLFSDSNGS